MKFHGSFWRIIAIFLAAAFILLPLSSCKTEETQVPTATATETLVIATPTPTPIPIPMAVVVNGEGIPLAYYEAELERFKLAYQNLGETLPAQEEIVQRVLDNLIDQLLLHQAALDAGFVVDEKLIYERTLNLVNELGSEEALNQWMAGNFYTSEDFRYAMSLAIGSAWQRDAIINAVPETTEQIHARQIFAFTKTGAETALSKLNAGTSFDDLAWQYSPETGGELGWFPRGYLTVPAVEEAAFALEVGAYSGIIESELGYHIILVLEKEAAHPLSIDARRSMQLKALADWIESQRALSVIEILVK